MAAYSDLLRALRQENSRLKEGNQILTEELHRLRQAIRSLNNLQHSLDSITPQTNVFALLNGILSAALEAVDSEDGSLLLLDEENNELVFVQVHGSSKERLTGYRFPAKMGIVGWVVANRTPQLVADVRQEPRFSPLVDQMTGFRTTSLMCVPLLDGDRVLGAIELVNPRNDKIFEEKDLNILLLVARLATIALLRAEGPRPKNK